MTNTVETVGQGVEQEATDKLVCVQRHDFGFAVVAIVFPAKSDAVVGRTDQPGIGDGDAVGITAKIGQDLRWSSEGRFGTNHPFDPAKIAATC